MICAFIDKNFDYEFKEIQRYEAVSLMVGEPFNNLISICIDSEYYIFFDREVYVEENMEKIAKLLTKVNFELMIKNQK